MVKLNGKYKFVKNADNFDEFLEKMGEYDC